MTKISYIGYRFPPVIIQQDGATTAQRTRINRPDDGSARCQGSRVRDQPNDFCPSTPPPTTPPDLSQDPPSIPSVGHANVARLLLRRDRGRMLDLSPLLFLNEIMPSASCTKRFRRPTRM